MTIEDRKSFVVVQKCDHCGQSHKIPIIISINQGASGVSIGTRREEVAELVVPCPNTKQEITVNVPVSLSSFEMLIDVHPDEAG